MRKNTNKYTSGIKRIALKAISPAFLIILLSSCLLWYMSKLSHEYTTEIPLDIRIDGQKYRVTAVASGRGSILMAHQLSLKKVSIRSAELTMRHSKDNPKAMTITHISLQKALTNRLNDLKIVQIVDAPDFVPNPEPRAGEAEPETQR